jgi:hypothetical protein
MGQLSAESFMVKPTKLVVALATLSIPTLCTIIKVFNSGVVVEDYVPFSLDAS